MQKTEVDGVPVLWQQVPAPLSAGLVLGVGRRDETFVGGGVTHLVEHLTMRALGRTVLDCNASVGLSVTDFTVSGPADRVVEHLEGVCRSLAALATQGPDPEALRLEADVLRAEGGDCAPPLAAYLMGRRYDGVDLGLAGLDEPALLCLDADQVRQCAARWFHRSNAVLWLTGPPPAGLALPLPGGAAPHRVRPQPRPGDGPHWVGAAEDAVGVSLEVSGVAAASGLRILGDRLQDALRHQRGWTYGVVGHSEPVRGDVEHVTVFADVREEYAGQAGGLAWAALADLARSGPSEEELRHDQDGAALYLQDPRTVEHALQDAATALLLGTTVPLQDERLRQTRELRPADVRDALQQALPGALLAVPAQPEPDLPGVTELRGCDCPPVTGEVHRRRLLALRAPERTLVVGAQGVSVLGRDDEQETIRWPDVLGLVDHEDGFSVLVGRHGNELYLDPRQWRRGEEALAAIRALVPADLQVTSDPQPRDEGTRPVPAPGARPALRASRGPG